MWAQDEWKTFKAWNAWRSGGRPSPRPTFLWLTQTGSNKRKVPAWAWQLRSEYLHANPSQPAPSHDRPYSRWTLDQIGGFGLRIAWMFTQGGRFGRTTPREFIELIKNAKDPITGAPLRFVSIEGYPASNDGELSNEPFMDDLIYYGHKAGKQVRLWERTDLISGFDHIVGMLERHPGFDVYEADLEDMERADASIAAKFATHPLTKDMPRTTLYAGMGDAHYYWPWIEAEFAAGTQAYAHENGFEGKPGHPVPPGITESMDRDCWWRGCYLIRGLDGKCSIPMIAVNQEGDGGLAHQLSTLEPFAGHGGIEWAETMSREDWALLGVRV